MYQALPRRTALEHGYVKGRAHACFLTSLGIHMYIYEPCTDEPALIKMKHRVTCPFYPSIHFPSPPPSCNYTFLHSSTFSPHSLQLFQAAPPPVPTAHTHDSSVHHVTHKMAATSISKEHPPKVS